MKPSFELVRSIIEELEEETEFGRLYDYALLGATDISSWIYEVEDFSDLVLKHGCTKIVVESPKISEWVLKIPRITKTDENYCETEVNNYKLACKMGLEKFFAPTFFFCNVDNIPIYIQKKVFCCEGDVSESFYLWMEKQMIEERYNYETDDEFDDAVYSASQELSLQETLRAMFEETDEWNTIDDLFCFCNRYHINDLHSGNFGYDNGRAIIIDFSEF